MLINSTIIIIVLAIFIVAYLCLNVIDHYQTNSNEITWCHSDNCKSSIPFVINNAFKQYHITKNDNKCDIYVPCSYNQIANEFNKSTSDHNPKYVFVLGNSDNITNKKKIWTNMVKHYGLKTTLNIMPKTYILSEEDDVYDLINNHKSSNIYILKKNIQRQRGLKLTNDLDDIKNGYDEGYVIAQELLQNPYLIDNRKINLRIYVLVIYKLGKVDSYMHYNGFMYYTKEYFKKNSLEYGPNITTGYIDRKVYQENPLTLDDFRKYLDDDNRKLSKTEISSKNKYGKLSQLVFNRISIIIKMVIDSAESELKNVLIDKNVCYFQLFGADIAISDKLFPMIMEFNKGPDLGIKDQRDGDVKKGVAMDILKVLGIVPNTNKHNFIKLS